MILDDGTVIEVDAADNVTVITEPSGSSYAPDRSILTSFAQSVLGGIGSAINRSLYQATAPSTPTPAASPAASPMLMMALIVGAGFVAYKLLAR